MKNIITFGIVLLMGLVSFACSSEAESEEKKEQQMIENSISER